MSTSALNTLTAPSVLSTSGTLATYARKLAQANGRPDMEIILDNHTEEKIYTTFDPLSGKVEITAPHNVRFDEIQVTLEGSIKTWVENMSPHSIRSKVSAYHNFLKMTMPINESLYPQPRIAEAGRTYIFPFNFVIPEHLLPKACAHGCKADHVHLAHLQLPPSMGDREVNAQDDLTPAMAKVTYAIKVKVIRNREQDDEKYGVIRETQRKLHVVPAQAEAPPMNITSDNDYTLSKSKALKKGMFSGKLGRITVSSAQPNAIILPSPASSSKSASGTMATINLRFDPHESSSKPPKLGSLVAKIKASTFYGTRPNQNIPSHGDMVANYEAMRGVYDTCFPLSSRCVESVTWEKHACSPDYMRRNSDSSNSSCSDSDASPSSKSKFYYEAKILVPFTLSSSKTWVPTFHSCIVSRIYAITLFLTIHTPGTGVPASTVALQLPVQIAASGSESRRATLTEEEAAMELAAVDQYLRPRIIEVPSVDLIGQSRLTESVELPPSYDDFAAPSRVQSRALVDPGRC